MTSARAGSRMPPGVAIALDAAFVLVFAAVGRASHDSASRPLAGGGNALLGVLATA